MRSANLAQVIAHPGCQVNRLEPGIPGFAVSAGQEQERFHDLTQMLGLALDQAQDAPVLARLALLSKGHLDVPLDGRQRRA